jgi:ribosomal protein S27AE
MGEEKYKNSFNEKCPKCGLSLVRLYRHKNPKKGKQKWVSMGWYCTRCKYVWMDEKPTED